MSKNYVSMNVYVDIDMSHFNDDELIEELESREYDCTKVKVATRNKYGEFKFPEFKNQIELQRFIKATLGLKEWHTKERIVSEINELFQ